MVSVLYFIFPVSYAFFLISNIFDAANTQPLYAFFPLSWKYWLFVCHLSEVLIDNGKMA